MLLLLLAVLVEKSCEPVEVREMSAAEDESNEEASVSSAVSELLAA